MSERQRINIRTSVQTRSQVKEKAAAEGKTMNQFVIDLIEAAVNEREARAKSVSKRPVSS